MMNTVHVEFKSGDTAVYKDEGMIFVSAAEMFIVLKFSEGEIWLRSIDISKVVVGKVPTRNAGEPMTMQGMNPLSTIPTAEKITFGFGLGLQ